jgi:acetyl-CoA acetyltransferase
MSVVLVADSEVSEFGKHEDHGLVECAASVVSALVDRTDGLSAVDSLWVGAARPGESEGWESGLAIAVAEASGLQLRSGTDVHAFCASSNVAFIHAAREIQAGRSDVTVVVGVEHMSTYRSTGPLSPGAMPEWAAELSPPVFYALCASRYMRDYGVSDEQFAELAVRNRDSATGNPRARFRTPVTAAEVLDSKMISEPLTLLQCSAPGDGSGAVLLLSGAGAERLGVQRAQCARVIGLGHRSATAPDTALLTSFPEDVAAAADAFLEAGLTPSDIDVLEVHDAFTIAQAIHLEDLGLAARGEGWKFGAEGARPVVNPSGGLLGRSHPLGATGMAQVDSIRRELGGSMRYGLVHEAGGLQHLGQLLSTVIILAAGD